jgi:hypothetical protein
MAGFEFIQVRSRVLHFTRAPEKSVFEHIFMKDHDSRVSAQHRAGAKMKTLIVAYVIDDRIVVSEEF